MKKILMLIMVCLSLSFGFDTWYGDESVYNITTGYDAGEEKSGYWFNYGDDSDGGASKIVWPVEAGTEFDINALDPIIDYCSGVCGTYELNKGTLDYNPFVGIGFNLAGENDEAADATDMGGICITYSVDIGASIEMGLGNEVDNSLGYDNPAVSVPKAATATTKDFAWTQFKQAGWGTGKITGTEAATKLVALKFKIQGATGSKGSFNIHAIGAKGTCTKTFGSSSIKSVTSMIKTNKSNTVYDIKGNLIGKDKTSADLMSMPQGLYIINIGTENYKFIVK